MTKQFHIKYFFLLALTFWFKPDLCAQITITDDLEICSGTGTILSVEDPNDYSVNFDGVNDELRIPNSDQINEMEVTERTIMFWFKPDNITAKQVIYEEGGGTNGIAFYLESNMIYGVSWRNSALSNSVSVAITGREGEWIHIALIFNSNDIPGEKMKLYLDGSLAIQGGSGDFIPNHTGNIRIGNAGNVLSSIASGNQPFSGNIDNFRLWNSVLDASQILLELNSKNAVAGSVVVDYNFDDQASPVTNNGSAGGNARLREGASYELDHTIQWDDPGASTNFEINVSPLVTTTYTATLTDSGGSSVSDSVVVTVRDLPTASAGGSQTTCPTGSTTVSGASADNGSILWTSNGMGILSDETTLTPTYLANMGDLGNTVNLTMTVSGEGSCSSETAVASYTINVADNEAPVLNDLSDLEISDCADDETIMSQVRVVTGLALPGARYSDNCSGTLTVQYRIQLPNASFANNYGAVATGALSDSDPSGFEFPEGVSTILFRVIDEIGNISNVESYTISVNHKPNPSEINF